MCCLGCLFQIQIQIPVCQTDICLAPLSLSFSFIKVQYTFYSDICICFIPIHLYIRFSKQIIYTFNFSRLFCNTSPLLSVIRRILVLTIQILVFTRRGTGTTPQLIRQGICTLCSLKPGYLEQQGNQW